MQKVIIATIYSFLNNIHKAVFPRSTQGRQSAATTGSFGYIYHQEIALQL